MSYETLKIEHRGAAAWVWMNRFEVRNAFDQTLIAELTDAFAALDRDPAVRAIALAGLGKSFSAGADLNWMKRQGASAPEANLSDARKLATLFRTISMCATPTLARVQGAALGGGMGLASACDICIASTTAQFATSEVRLGIIPAAIGSYVVRAIGERQAYRYFQSAERIGAARARDRSGTRGDRTRRTGCEGSGSRRRAAHGRTARAGSRYRTDPRGRPSDGRRRSRRGHRPPYRHAARDA